jgi:CheY-like chemotaxis protein
LPQGGHVKLRATAVDLDPQASRELDVTPGSYVRLELEDDGVGMDAQTVAHAFEPFYTTKPDGLGTGLGLASVYGIARQGGGAARLRSAPGEGTTVEVYLPRPTAAGTASASADTRAEVPPTAQAPRVLVVEDEDVVRRVVCRVLEGMGFEVLQARGAAEIEQALGDRTVSLLLTDVVLRDGDGGAVAESLRQRFPDVRVWHMSGYPANVLSERATLPENLRLLSKPFSVTQLEEAVREALDA